MIRHIHRNIKDRNLTKEVKMTKNYCTQNNGECGTCSLVNYSRDCRNVALLTDKDLYWVATQYISECCDTLIERAYVPDSESWVYACSRCGKAVGGVL